MHINPPDTELGALLVQASLTGRPVPVSSTLEPEHADMAYAIQLEILVKRRQKITGWKVGAKTPDSTPHCAALPQDCLLPQNISINSNRYPVLGLELEIAFTFSRDFLPRPIAYSEEEVLSSLHQMCTTVEIVSSRIASWPDTGGLTQLADFQNHGALIVGELVDYDQAFPYMEVAVELQLDQHPLFSGSGKNNAGDPRRLLPWLVNHCRRFDVPLIAGDLVTCGSYVGVHFPNATGAVNGRIGTLPPISFDLA